MTPARRSATRELLRLAWPAALSFLLGNAYRINDQLWIQALGGAAQAAIGATFFVVVMNFAAMFLAVGGTLALVARATGAADPAFRDRVARHALLLAAGIGLALTVVGRAFLPEIVALLGLEGEEARHAESYLGTLYLFTLPLSLTPALDNVFLGRGDSRTPMVLQLGAVGLNYLLNPLLVYGPDAAERVAAPGAGLAAAAAARLGVDGLGIAGAAVATGLSRTATVTLGLVLLRVLHGTRPVAWGRPSLALVGRIARIGAPSAASIAVYAGVYWALLGLVLAELPTAVTAGLGVGFQVFEGMAFPCYLGVSVAGASLVGRALGARDPDRALEVVRGARRVGRALGLAFGLAFLLLVPAVVPVFTDSAAVAEATTLYVRVLAVSQVWVAAEAVNERVLIGAGHTRPILWITTTGNALRVPLAWLLALALGLGALGVWLAIVATTALKAWWLWREVERRRWLAPTAGG